MGGKYVMPTYSMVVSDLRGTYSPGGFFRLLPISEPAESVFGDDMTCYVVLTYLYRNSYCARSTRHGSTELLESWIVQVWIAALEPIPQFDIIVIRFVECAK